MLAALPYGLVFTLPLVLAVGLHFGGAWSWATLGVVFVFIPAVDALVGRDEGNDPKAASWLFDAWLVAWVPVQLLMIAWTVTSVVAGRPLFEAVGLVLSCGVMCGAGGINVGHELMHRSGRFHRGLAEVLLTSVTYPHFCVEHVLGHHKNVGTPADPATSRLGEGVYSFVPRSLLGGLLSAWRLETARVAKQNIGIGLRDRRVRYTLWLVVLYAAIFAAFGWLGVAVFAAQGAIAFVLLEIINYVEHYGLTRKTLSEGRFERVQPRHSWNAPQRVSNWYLFNLARHADHHFLASRTYPELRHFEDAPQLPAGYGTMFLVALVPPLWRRIMDDRVRQTREQAPQAPSSAAASPV